MISVTIDQSSLGSPDLVISDEPVTSGLCLGDGVVRPAFQPRKTYAPDSQYVDGKQLISVVQDQGEFNFPVILRGSSLVEVELFMYNLESALWQFSYDLTLKLGDATYKYAAEPAIPTYGRVFVGQLATHTRLAAVSVAVNPIPRAVV